MLISSKTKKISLILGSSLLLAGGIFVLSASPARAGWLDIVTNPGEIFYTMMGMMANLFFSVAAWFVRIAATLLEFTFSIEKFTDVAVVKAGWQICRDIANIGFVLVLLVLAFDSVLQTGNYQIKSILPRLVIAALLINFSLVFCGMIIDFSQIMTHYFYEAAVGSNPAGLSGQLAGALNIQSVFTEPTGDWGAQLKKGDITSLIIGILFGTAILLIAAFSLAAAAIYFIVRIVTLWMLMIFAPIAWVAMIVPNAPEIGGYWGKWWGEFLKWSFFAPVYMFFIYLAILMASTASIVTSSSLTATAQDTLLKANSVSGFLGKGAGVMLQYIAIIMVLLAGLKYASKSGVAFSGAVMKAGGSATNWAKNKAKKYTVDKAVEAGKWGLNKAEVGAAKLAAVNVGGPETRFSGRMRAKAEQIRQKGFAEREKSDKNQAYGKLLDTMSEKDLLSEVGKSSGIRKLIAARKAKEKGLLEKGPKDLKIVDKNNYNVNRHDYEEGDEGTRKYEKDKEKRMAQYETDLAAAEIDNKPKRELDKKNVREAMKIFNTYGVKDDKGLTKETKELEEMRFDAIENADEQKKAIRRAKESGNLEKAKASAVADTQAMASLQEELNPVEFSEIFKKWGKATKSAAEISMKQAFTDAFSDPGEIKKREIFASCTGKLNEAFKDQKTGGMIPADKIGEYVHKMKPTEIGNIFDEKDLQLIGDHITEGQVRSIRNELSAKQKSLIRKGDKGGESYFTNNPAWN